MSSRSALGATRSRELPSSPRTELVLLSEPHDSSPPSSPDQRAAGSGVRRSPVARSGEPLDEDDRTLRESIGKNLRRLRSERTLSYEKLSRASGVSRAMLNQIELGQSAPTTTLLLKIARALRVTIAALLQPDDSPVLHVQRRTEARTLVAAGGAATTRLLSRPGARGPKLEEFLIQVEGKLSLDAAERVSRKALVVARGQLRLTVDGATFRLGPGDSIDLAPDHTIAFENQGSEEVSGYFVTYPIRK